MSVQGDKPAGHDGEILPVTGAARRASPRVAKAADGERLGLFIGYREETIDNTMARVELRLKSDPNWRFSPSERREKQALCDDMCGRLIDAGVPIARFKVAKQPLRFLDQLRHVRGYLEPRILALQNKAGGTVVTQNDRDGTPVRQRGIIHDHPEAAVQAPGEPAVHRSRRRGRPPGDDVEVEAIRAYRKRCSLTQEQLAEKADLTYPEVVRIENSGRANDQQLRAIAEVFGTLLEEAVSAESLKRKSDT
jgi:DNA-binding XRE family transcriptional regulator